MNPRRKILLLVLIMFLVVTITEAITIGILYRTAISEERSRLVETARRQVRLIEAIIRFDKVYSKDYSHG